VSANTHEISCVAFRSLVSATTVAFAVRTSSNSSTAAIPGRDDRCRCRRCSSELMIPESCSAFRRKMEMHPRSIGWQRVDRCVTIRQEIDKMKRRLPVRRGEGTSSAQRGVSRGEICVGVQRVCRLIRLSVSFSRQCAHRRRFAGTHGNTT
jgi:hypothetical protein